MNVATMKTHCWRGISVDQMLRLCARACGFKSRRPHRDLKHLQSLPLVGLKLGMAAKIPVIAPTII